METLKQFLACLVLAVVLVCAGWLFGRASAVKNKGDTETVVMTDTVWTTVHDTVFKEVTTERLRHDTVRFAIVDTAYIHDIDSIYVEIPIDRKTFVGENWTVIAHGYNVGLDGVWFSYPQITHTVTNTVTRNKRWAFSVGAQIGYGYTIHGGSPYVGLGAGFGYTF